MNNFIYIIKTNIGDVVMINLNTKERMLLQDEKSHEELCIQKYQDYANISSSTPKTQVSSNLDKFLCQDSLSTEKHVSSTYNTAIFEFRDKNIRNVLNHIQKEEQEHGEQIYNYMHQHGMY